MKQTLNDSKNEAAEKKLLNTIVDWVGANKRVFWKYEVSCFYKTYKLSVANLPNPSVEDIRVISENRLLNNDQKKKLCTIIKKACSGAGGLNNSRVTFKIDFDNDRVVASAVPA